MLFVKGNDMVNLNSYFSKLNLDENGVWYNREINDISYPNEGSDFCYSIEDDSFWFQHRNNCIVSVLKKFLKKSESVVFDVGGGNGYVSKAIQNEGYTVALIEPSDEGTKNAIKRGVKYIACCTIEYIDTTDNYLPNVGLFDVIEHIEDDEDFLIKINAMMEENGLLFITVPAYSLLWSHEDVIAGHYRRYTRKEIEDLLIRSGFYIEYSSYFFKYLVFPIFLLRTIPSFLFKRKFIINENRVRAQHSSRSSFLSRVLKFFLNREVYHITNLDSINFGGSCIIVARKIAKD